MADDHTLFHHAEIDQTLLDITFRDEAGQPVGPRQVVYQVDRATGQIMSLWLEAPSAPASEEPSTVP